MHVDDLYRLLVENFPGLICCFDRDGVITFVNDSFAKYYNLDRQELLGSNFFARIPAQERKRIAADISELTPDIPMQTYRYRIISQNGQMRWLKLGIRAVFEKIRISFLGLLQISHNFPNCHLLTS